MKERKKERKEEKNASRREKRWKKERERGKKEKKKGASIYFFCYSILAYALSVITIGVNGTSNYSNFLRMKKKKAREKEEKEKERKGKERTFSWKFSLLFVPEKYLISLCRLWFISRIKKTDVSDCCLSWIQMIEKAKVNGWPLPMISHSSTQTISVWIWMNFLCLCPWNDTRRRKRRRKKKSFYVSLLLVIKDWSASYCHCLWSNEKISKIKLILTHMERERYVRDF